MFKFILWPFRILFTTASIGKKLLSMLLITLFSSLVLLLLAALTINFWLPTAIKIYSKHKFGFTIIVRESRCNVFNGIIDFRDLIIQNPKGQFECIDLAKFDIISGKLALTEMVKKSMTIDNIVLNLRELWISRPPISVSNIEILIDRFTKSGHKAETNENTGDSCHFIAKTVTVKIGIVNFLNFNLGKKRGKKLRINYSKDFYNVSNWEYIAKQLCVDFFKYDNDHLISSFFSSMTEIPELNMVTTAIKSINSFFKKTINNLGRVTDDNAPTPTTNPPSQRKKYRRNSTRRPGQRSTSQ